nr:hypothetical protein [Parvibaculum sedimenti]
MFVEEIEMGVRIVGLVGVERGNPRGHTLGHFFGESFDECGLLLAGRLDGQGENEALGHATIPPRQFFPRRREGRQPAPRYRFDAGSRAQHLRAVAQAGIAEARGGLAPTAGVRVGDGFEVETVEAQPFLLSREHGKLPKEFP